MTTMERYFTAADIMFQHGMFGHRNLTSGAQSIAGDKFYYVEALVDSVINYTSQYGDNSNGESLEKGKTISGFFTSVSVTSGRVRAYLMPGPNTHYEPLWALIQVQKPS